MRVLHQRHPAHDNPLVYLRIITIIAVFVFLMLGVFTPFNFQRFPEDRIWWFALLYAGTAYLTMLVCLLWIVWFPSVFAAKYWTLGKELVLIVYQFSTISFSVWWLTRFLGGDQLQGKSYIYTWSIVAAGGILPYLVATLLSHVYQLRKHLREAMSMEQGLAAKRLTPMPHQLTVPELLVPLSTEEFLFAKSEGNYLHILAEKGDTLQRYTVRGTLRRFLVDNAQHRELFQCHRAYIVNLSHIQAVEGNAAGCFLTIRESLPSIPVSRAHVVPLKAALG